MVQLWSGIPPEVLCDMYLNSCLNEGLNLLIRHHMAKGHRIDGWIRNGCIHNNKTDIIIRLCELQKEATRRGKIWNYGVYQTDIDIVKNYSGNFDIQTNVDNVKKLSDKCRACRYRETKCKGKEKCEDRLKARGMV